ncbi:hypothetical protein HAX54_038522, partial [Datura stramonium]|nr:hypothetical protein [Datura stramonium]
MEVEVWRLHVGIGACRRWRPAKGEREAAGIVLWVVSKLAGNYGGLVAGVRGRRKEMERGFSAVEDEGGEVGCWATERRNEEEGVVAVWGLVGCRRRERKREVGEEKERGRPAAAREKR